VYTFIQREALTLQARFYRVDHVTVTPGQAAVKKGETEQFSAAVEGLGSPPQTVTWTLEGRNPAGTVVVPLDDGTTIVGGLLTVSAAEDAARIIVTARSTINATVFGTATVIVSDDPMPVGTLTASVLTHNRIELNALAPITGGTIRYGIQDGTGFATIKWLAGTSRNFTGLSPNTEYEFFAQWVPTGQQPVETRPMLSAFIATARQSQSRPSAPAAPGRDSNVIMPDNTATVTLRLDATLEYGINTGTAAPDPNADRDGSDYGWQKSNVFADLEADTQYRFFARRAQTNTHDTSPPSGARAVRTAREIPEAPEMAGRTTNANKTQSTIVLSHELPLGQLQFGISTSATAPAATLNTSNSSRDNGWQNSPTFNNLEPGEPYHFFARTRQTSAHSASPASEPIRIVALSEPAPARPAAPLAVGAGRSTRGEDYVDLAHARDDVEFIINRANRLPTQADIENEAWADVDGEWTDSLFDDLSPNTRYWFFARITGNTDPANATAFGPSAASTSRQITTTFAALDRDVDTVTIQVLRSGAWVDVDETTVLRVGDRLKANADIQSISGQTGTLQYQWMRPNNNNPTGGWSNINRAQGGLAQEFTIDRSEDMRERGLRVRVRVPNANSATRDLFSSPANERGTNKVLPMSIVKDDLNVYLADAVAGAARTHNSVTLGSVALPGVQYGRLAPTTANPGNIRWQNAPRFTSLARNTDFTFFIRVQAWAHEGTAALESDASSSAIRTLGATQSRPAAPTAAGRLENSITLNPVRLTAAEIRLGITIEYAMNTVNRVPNADDLLTNEFARDWQGGENGNVFNVLEPDTQYFFFARKAQNDQGLSGNRDARQPSPPSVSRAITTSSVIAP
jgi:hypothetical protein